ncbi:phosphate/phosphite/phosphonate ABC transporter substrate-binding protein [Asticcacaulis machinosus]|uniref:Phosphate/phosphite/phosphonate ABC transporter substrate-binding protein n=1 Tax=Asticcacaulis machinosus TaxID=2984211 RepID=A0ABT5HH73_9CAUL|nr:phosphate/phosphite/phosphonate ABC transporter substrate-binding protein [Asticcacaulis machinosus]MDC7675543.1 phosphate/phosphite/phosphonate ABC transporter substrate-binding protein [Asticcacaulis machinosus]
MHMLRSGLVSLVLAMLAALTVSGPAMAAKPLRVILIPADGGTEDGTRADYRPLFNAISRQTGLTFDIRVGQSYGAVVEAMCNGSADIAFVGAVTFVQAHQRKCAELLAVAVEKGQSSYYAGLFTRSTSPIKTVAQIKGKRVAFGDINSASAFVFPVSMIMDAGLDPVKDLSALRLTGSHASSLAALTQNQVDVAALSFDSFDKAIRQGAVDPKSIRVIAKSIAIPYPPIVMNTRLPASLKVNLKSAFETVHTAPGVTPDMIRGYGGAKVDRYDTKFSAAKFSVAARTMARIDDRLKGEILKKASAR